MENNYTLDAEILTEGGEGRKFDFDCETLAGQVCAAVLTEEKCPYDTDVFLLVTDEEEVHRMNLEYRGIDRTTDVLSFPAVDFPQRFPRLGTGSRIRPQRPPRICLSRRPQHASPVRI